MHNIVNVYFVITSGRLQQASNGMVASPARGQLNKEIKISLSPFPPENLVSPDRFGCPVPRNLLDRD